MLNIVNMSINIHAVLFEASLPHAHLLLWSLLTALRLTSWPPSWAWIQAERIIPDPDPNCAWNEPAGFRIIKKIL